MMLLRLFCFIVICCFTFGQNSTANWTTVFNLLTQLSGKVSLMEANMATKNEITALKEAVLNSVSDRHHEYVPEFARALELTSTSLNCTFNGSTKYSTEHSVYFDGYVFTIGAKHSQCYQHIGIPRLIFNNIDVVLRTGCPVSKNVLNVSIYVPLRTGDEASTLGYVDGASRFWHGRLSGRLHQAANVSGTIFTADEYLFEGVLQIQGMSGGATLNGYGYTGMVHGLQSYTNPAPAPHFAVVIPAESILGTFQQKVTAAIKTQYMKKLGDCPGVTVLQIPRY